MCVSDGESLPFISHQELVQQNRPQQKKTFIIGWLAGWLTGFMELRDSSSGGGQDMPLLARKIKKKRRISDYKMEAGCARMTSHSHRFFSHLFFVCVCVINLHLNVEMMMPAPVLS